MDWESTLSGSVTDPASGTETLLGRAHAKRHSGPRLAWAGLDHQGPLLAWRLPCAAARRSTPRLREQMLHGLAK